MEMNFPHPAVRNTAAHDRHDHRAMLAAAIARQANSRTARAMAVASAATYDTTDTKRAMVEQLIHYFGSGDQIANPPFGAFSSTIRPLEIDKSYSEPGVYQNASTNIKAHDLNFGGTGEQSNHAGHGASRTLC